MTSPAFIQAMTDDALAIGCQEAFALVSAATQVGRTPPTFVLDTLELLLTEAHARRLHELPRPVEPRRLLGDIDLSDASTRFQGVTEQD